MATSDRLLPQRSKDGTKVKGRHEGGGVAAQVAEMGGTSWERACGCDLSVVG